MNIKVFFILLFIVNTFSYLMMWLDKLKSVYQWWRIRERTLWMLALLGGVFGIWLGMQAPLYHKAGKRKFRIGIPVIAFFWIVLVIFVVYL